MNESSTPPAEDVLSGLADVLGMLWNQIYTLLDQFVEAELFFPSLLVLVVGIWLLGKLGGFVFRTILVAFSAAALYSLLVSIDAIRAEGSDAQNISILIAIGFAIAMMARLFNKASKKAFFADVVIEVLLVAALLFFLNSFNPELLVGDRAQGVLERTAEFWSRIFDGASTSLDELS